MLCGHYHIIGRKATSAGNGDILRITKNHGTVIAQYLLPDRCEPINVAETSDEKLGLRVRALSMGVAECDWTTAMTPGSVPKSMPV